MKILVTGGAGFIGSHLCDALIEENHDVVAVDNLALGRESNIADLRRSERFRFIHADVLDPAFDAIVANGGFECVFHMAANSDIARSHQSPAIDLDNTFMTTFRLLEAMRNAVVKRLVFASTSAIYGEAKTAVAEDFGPLAPISHYGAAKLASEAFISSYGENYGVQSWITRFPNVVGPRSTHGVVYDFIQKLRRTPSRLEVLGDGSQEKPYLEVRDLVDAILLVWRETDERTNIYNVGSDTRTKVSDIARIVVEETGLDAKIVYSGGNRGWIGDVPKFEYDHSRIAALGWTPRMTSDEAIRAAARAIWKEHQ